MQFDCRRILRLGFLFLDTIRDEMWTFPFSLPAKKERKKIKKTQEKRSKRIIRRKHSWISFQMAAAAARFFPSFVFGYFERKRKRTVRRTGARIICASAFIFKNFYSFSTWKWGEDGARICIISLFRTLSKTHRRRSNFVSPFENIQLDKNLHTFVSVTWQNTKGVWDCCCCIITIKLMKTTLNIVDSGCITFFFRFFVCVCVHVFSAWRCIQNMDP